MKLTKASVARLHLPQDKSELLIFDDDLAGFGIRVRAGGKRTWIAQYRHGAKQRRMTIGTVAGLDEGEARRRAKTVLSKVHLGADPQAEKIEARKALAPVVDLGAVVQSYLTKAENRLRPRSLVEVTRHLQKHWKPLHGLPMASVGRADVAVRLNVIARERGLVAANRARATLSALFAWAIGEGMTSTNPVIGTNKPAEESARDRVLSDAELVEIWRRADGQQFGAIVRLLILTGQRRGEVAGMRQAEIDLERKVWTIPGERTKNHRAHVVPLSGACLAILEGVVCKQTAVFPPTHWSHRKEQLDAGLRHVEPWCLHDLRRTAATRMADLGVQPHIVEAVLNHASGHRAGVAGVYNRATYEGEKRTALNIWAERVLSLAEGRENVVVGINAKMAKASLE